jgi:hypothetical protein
MDDWYRRDVKILEAVGQLEAEGAKVLNAQELAPQLGLEFDDVVRGIRALDDAGYIELGSKAINWVIFFGPRLLERGRRELHLWPADGYDALIAVLERPRVRSSSHSSQPSARSVETLRLT